jgi:hypothetical protein
MMFGRIRPNVGSAHVLASIALFAALGGGGALALGAAGGGGGTQLTACYVKRGFAADGRRTGDLRSPSRSAR